MARKMDPSWGWPDPDQPVDADAEPLDADAEEART